jgi:hypothetical protein
MQDSPVPAIAMIIGLLLMAAGYFSPSVTPTSAVWSDEQAVEYGKAAARLHNASYGASHDHSQQHSHEEDPHKSPEYVAAKEAFEKSKAALDRARSRQSFVKYFLILSGVIITGVGIAQAAMTKMKADDQPRGRRGR